MAPHRDHPRGDRDADTRATVAEVRALINRTGGVDPGESRRGFHGAGSQNPHANAGAARRAHRGSLPAARTRHARGSGQQPVDDDPEQSGRPWASRSLLSAIVATPLTRRLTCIVSTPRAASRARVSRSSTRPGWRRLEHLALAWIGESMPIAEVSLAGALVLR